MSTVPMLAILLAVVAQVYPKELVVNLTSNVRDVMDEVGDKFVNALFIRARKASLHDNANLCSTTLAKVPSLRFEAPGCRLLMDSQLPAPGSKSLLSSHAPYNLLPALPSSFLHPGYQHPASGFTLHAATMDAAKVEAERAAKRVRWESAAPHTPSRDKHQWLEDLTNEKVLRWVETHNKRTLRSLGNPRKSSSMREIQRVLESEDRIPYVTAIGDFVYNDWADEEHSRGVWRRTTMSEYKKQNPMWEIVIDLDALGKMEGEPWVWENCVFLEEPGKPTELVLVHLSRGGSDAVVVREFNLTSKSFVPPPVGFHIDASRSDVSWEDKDTLLVGTDLGRGSMTTSGYPRQVRSWKRGTPLKDAPVIFNVQNSDLSAIAYRMYDRRNCIYDWRCHQLSFYATEYSLKIVEGPGASPEFHKLDLPVDIEVSTFADQLLLMTKSQYQPAEGISFPAGALIATSVADYVAGARDRWVELFRPAGNKTLDGFTAVRDYIVLQVLDNVKGSLLSWKYTVDGQWKMQSSYSATHIESISAKPFDPKNSNAVWIESESFLSPPKLSLASSASDISTMQSVKCQSSQFDAEGFVAMQQWATSDDGTLVPYFLVKDASVPQNQPTILLGYGGFEESQKPHYLSVVGPSWLQRGGVFALANIRGGGEYGPAWHKAALKEHKHRSYEDFAAIAKDLSNRGITSPEKLGIVGGSNGGLLVGNMLVKYPELFGAVVGEVPLLDMWRYNKLLGGESWAGEYGDPDNPEEWNFLRTNSPYHLVNPEVSLPPALFITHTKEDRVHPGHARKMVAKLLETPQGASVGTSFLYENMNEGGGHRGAPDAMQTAFIKALEFEFFRQTLDSTNLKNMTARIKKAKRSSAKYSTFPGIIKVPPVELVFGAAAMALVYLEQHNVI